MSNKKKLLYSVFIIILFLFINNHEFLYAENNKPEKVSLSLQWLTQCQFAGYYAALENGFYSDEGLDLTINPGAGDINSIKNVESGISEFGTKWLADFLKAKDSGAEIISIAQILQSNGLIMLSKSESEIKTPYDFKGKKIGIWYFGNEIQFYTLINNLKIPPDSMEILPQQWSIEPFLDNEYDAVMAMNYNEYLRILDRVKDKNKLNIIDFRDYGFNFPGHVIFTKEETAENNPELCEKMVRASLRGWKWAMENQEKAVDIVLKHDRTGILEREHQLKQMKEITNLIQSGGIKLGYHSEKQSSFVIKSLFENNIIADPDSLAESYTNNFVEKAYKKGITP